MVVFPLWDTIFRVFHRDIESLIEIIGSGLAVLYLIITPFIWRKLVNLTEKIGWGIGSITAGTAFITWVIGELDFQLRVIIGIIGILILVGTAIKHRKNDSIQEDIIIENEKSHFPILPQFRNDYHHHVEGLFREIKNNLNPLIDDSDYFTALQKTKEKKRMIFQHLRTTDLLSDMYSHLFALYKISIAEINDLEKKKKEIIRNVSDYDEKLNGYEFGNKEGEWIDFEDFKKAIGIKRNNSTKDFFNDEPLYPFPSSINCNLYVKEDDDGFKLGYAGHWFAKSNDKEKLEQFKGFIYEHGHGVMNQVSEIHSKLNSIYMISTPWFNREFKEHDEALEGEPVFGACLTCLGWFNAKNEKKYKPILQDFNSQIANYEETVWTNEDN